MLEENNPQGNSCGRTEGLRKAELCSAQERPRSGLRWTRAKRSPGKQLLTTGSHKVQERSPLLHTAVLLTLIFGKQEPY